MLSIGAISTYTYVNKHPALVDEMMCANLLLGTDNYPSGIFTSIFACKN